MSRDLSEKSRRGRRTLFWTLGLVLAARLVVGLLLDYRWTHVRFPSAAEACQRLQAGPDIVFLGSSRFGSEIVPALIGEALGERTGRPPGVVDAHVPAGDAISAEYILERMLAAGVRPALLVVEVAPENLSPRNDFLKMHVHRQLTWRDLPWAVPESFLSGDTLRLLAARALPVYVHRREICRNLRAWAFPNVQPEAPLAETPPPPADAEADRERMQRTAAYAVARWLRKYRIGGEAPQALERSLQRCGEQHIEVLLVAPPRMQVHRAQYTPEKDALYRAYVQRLVRTYGCRFADCRAFVPDELFKDNHHANPDGALYFSRRLAAEVLAPVWLTGRGEQRGVRLTPAG